MTPINQVFLGSDPLLGTSTLNNSIDDQLQLLEKYRQNLEAAKQMKQQIQQPTQIVKFIWDDIDKEIEPMTEEQKNKLMNNDNYRENYNKLQSMVNVEILNLVKSKIESTQEGKELLENQLKLVRKLKSNIIEESNREMDLFKRFKEYSKNNPNVTYEEFIKDIL